VITEHDLQEAIAACEGERKPNASTCIKLAAFYTIRDHLFPKEQMGEPVFYSQAAPREYTAEYESDTEFWQAIRGMHPDDIMPIMDELMSALQVLNPRLYAGVMRKIFDN
jgi:hypothetical protein